MKKGILLIPFATMAMAGDYQVHVLQPGETISELLSSRGYHPLYGAGNWVDKTLKMNHMQATDAARIKESLPIILPGKTEPVIITETEFVRDFVKTEKAAVMRTGLFGNTVSDHQKLFLELDYYSSSISLGSTNIQLNENYGLGLKVDGENDYKIGNLTYNINGSAFIYTHGTGQFKKIDGLSASYDPTYQLESHMEIEAPEVSFNFGPSITLEEKSRVTENDEIISIRRDRTAWLGFQLNKIMEVDHLRYETFLGYKRNIAGESLTSSKSFNASQLYFNAKINLTADYDFTAKLATTQFDNIGINQENRIGFNFSYNLK